MCPTSMHNGRQKSRSPRSIYQIIFNVIIKTENRIYFLPSIFNAMVIRKFYSWMEYVSKFVVLIHRTYFYHMNSLTHYDHL